MQVLLFPVRLVLATLNLVLLCGAGVVATLCGMRPEKAVQMVLPRWARLNLRICSLDLEIVRGAEHLDAARPCVFIANHQGLLDLFVFPTLFWNVPMFWPVKKELAWVPFLGWLAWISRQPMIDRADHTNAMVAMDRCRELLAQGLCSVVFPEGTRSRDGRLGTFKKGAFRLAMDGKVPLVPITLIDCSDRMPMGTYRLTPGTIHVVIDPPLSTGDWCRENLQRRIDDIRDRMRRTIHEERQRLGLPPTPDSVDPLED